MENKTVIRLEASISKPDGSVETLKVSCYPEDLTQAIFELMVDVEEKSV